MIEDRAVAKSELQTFDGLDNRRELMLLLQRLGSDAARAEFLCRLAGHSRNGFAAAPVRVANHCSPIAAYFMLVGLCNEVGVSVNEAARLLELEVKKL